MSRSPTTALTEEVVNATSPPSEGYVELRERGLVLRISYTGRRSWSYEYRSPASGKNTRVAVAAVTVAEARAIAQRFRTAVISGRDPRFEKQEALTAYRADIEHKLSVMKAVRWAEKNGANVAINPDGSYSLTFKGAAE